MRLTKTEVHIIKNTILKFDAQAKLFVFGSRTNDQAKGGDIDLLVISEVITFSEKVSILTEIKSQPGEQKIDLLIKTSDSASELNAKSLRSQHSDFEDSESSTILLLKNIHIHYLHIVRTGVKGKIDDQSYPCARYFLFFDSSPPVRLG